MRKGKMFLTSIPVKRDLKQVEKKIFKIIEKTEKLIPGVRKYVLNGGKRIRPALLLISYHMLKNADNNDNSRYAINFATLVEVIHNISLLHDDVIEGADLRRGKRTLNSVSGSKIAVLVGDLLSTSSVSLIYSLRNIKVMEQMLGIVGRTAKNMCEGEIEELMSSYKINIAEEKYLCIVRKKTAALFAASCEIGSMLAKAKEEDVRMIKEYGLNIGMAFQIVDDVLDYVGSRRKLGKPVASDLIEGKATLPLIYAFKSSDKEEKAGLKKILSAVKKNKYLTGKNRQRVRGIFKKYDCINLSFKKAREYIARAKKSISILPDNRHRKALYGMATFIAERKF